MGPHLNAHREGVNVPSGWLSATVLIVFTTKPHDNVHEFGQ